MKMVQKWILFIRGVIELYGAVFGKADMEGEGNAPPVPHAVQEEHRIEEERRQDKERIENAKTKHEKYDAMRDIIKRARMRSKTGN